MTSKTIFAAACSCLLVIAGIPNFAEAAAKPSAIERSAENIAAAVAEEVIEMNTDATFFVPAPTAASSSSALSLFPQLVRLRELLSAATQTKLPTIKTKTYVDKTLGVTLRYPSTLPVKVISATDDSLSSFADMMKIYEFKSKGSGVPAFTFAAVGGEMGELYWSFFELGLSQGLSDGVFTNSTSSKYSSATRAINNAFVLQKKSVEYQGYELKHEYWSFNGKPVLGMYTATRTTPEGAFLGVVSLYTTLPVSAKDKKFVLSEQAAKDNVVTILEKSVLNPKKIQNYFD